MVLLPDKLKGKTGISKVTSIRIPKIRGTLSWERLERIIIVLTLIVALASFIVSTFNSDLANSVEKSFVKLTRKEILSEEQLAYLIGDPLRDGRMLPSLSASQRRIFIKLLEAKDFDECISFVIKHVLESDVSELEEADGYYLVALLNTHKRDYDTAAEYFMSAFYLYKSSKYTTESQMWYTSLYLASIASKYNNHKADALEVIEYVYLEAKREWDRGHLTDNDFNTIKQWHITLNDQIDSESP